MAISRLNGLVLWQVKGNEESHCLSLSAKELSTFVDKSQTFTNANAGERDPPVVLRYANLLDASHNRIKAVNGMIDMVPSVWWASLKHNFLTTSSTLATLPTALGALDLSNNPITSDALHVLAHMHILRLYVYVGGTLAKDRETLALCPNTWVFNDNYFVHRERAEMEVAISNTDIWKDIESKVVGNGLLGCDMNFFDDEMNTPARTPGGPENTRLQSMTGSLDLSVEAEHSMVNGPDAPLGVAASPVPVVDGPAVPLVEGGGPSTVDPGGAIEIPTHQVSTGELDKSLISDEMSVQSEVSANAYSFGNWGFRAQGNREGAFLAALHTFTPTANYPIDFYRLDVLLEDYIDEACLANANNIPYKAVHGQMYPMVDVMEIISLPRRVKMDLSVLLSICIIVELPRLLVVDVAIQMLADYMSPNDVKDLFRLPCFAKTALVGLMRRVLKKEEEELAGYGALIDKSLISAHKPVVPPGPDGFIPTYTGTSEGWFHLYEVLHYLHRPIQELEKILYKANMEKAAENAALASSTSSKKTESVVPAGESLFRKSGSLTYSGIIGPDGNSSFMDSIDNSSQTSQASKSKIDKNGVYRFSLLEYQLLGALPVIVTPTTPTYHAKYAQETQWINLAARHVVVLFAKSALCPSLTQAQVSAKAQGLYIELIPLLRLAKMTHSDLTDANEGEKNGRENIHEAVNHWEAEIVAQREKEIKKLASENDVALLLADISTNKLHKRSGLIDGELAFGAGLPRGAATKLTWRKEGKLFEHDYDWWNDHKHPERRDLRLVQHVQLQERKKEELRKVRGHAIDQTLSPPFKETTSYRPVEGSPVQNTHKKESHVQFMGGDLDDLSMGSLSVGSSIILDVDPAHTTSHVFKDGVISGSKVSVTVPSSHGSSLEINPLLVSREGGEAEHKTMTDAITDDFESPKHSRVHMLSSDGDFNHSITDSPQSMLHGEFIDHGGASGTGNASHFTTIEGSVVSSYNVPSQQIDRPLSPSNVLNMPNSPPRAGSANNDNRVPSPKLQQQQQQAMNSVVSPNRSVNVINGFSANAQRESNFLLAPTRVALEQNRKAGGKASEKLSMLHQAPVMVHPKSPGILPMPSMVPGNNTMVSVKSVPDFPGKFTYGASGSFTNQDDGSVSVASSSSESTYTPAAAARQLLAEMGTLRNIRNLLIDDNAYRAPKVHLNSRFDNSGNFQASGRYGSELPGNDGFDGDNVFLTNAGDNYGDEHGQVRHPSSMPNEGAYHSGATFATTKSNPSPKVFKMRDLDTILTSADLLKMKTQYNNIFTTEQVNASKGTTNNYSKNKGYGYGGGHVGQQHGMRAEDQAVDGRPLSASWYPVPKKPTFTLAPETKDSLDAAIKDIYGVANIEDSRAKRPVSREPKIPKNTNQVTYTTQKLRVRQPAGAKAPAIIPHPAAKSLEQGKEKGRFQSNIYENNNATNASHQFAALSTSKLAVSQHLPSLMPWEHSDINTGIKMQPAVKTDILFTANNYGNDDSSLEGQRENYAYVPKLGLSTKFKVKGNTAMAEVGLKFSVASSK